MLTLPAHVLRDLLAGTALAATRDLTLPVLHSVHLRWDDPLRDEVGGDGAVTLTAEATDRYRMHEGKAPAVADAPGEALVDRRDVEALVKTLPKRAKVAALDPAAVLTVEEHALVVEVDGNVRRLPLVRLEGGRTFPKVERLWPAPAQVREVDQIAVNPALVGDLAKIPAGKAPVAWALSTDGRLGPIVAEPAAGAEHDVITWRALVMPIRVNPGGAA